MKALTFTLMMLVGIFSYAEDSSINQDGTVTNNGAMNLYGVNSNNNSVDVSYDSFGGGVRCASPTMGITVDQSYLPESQKITTVGTSLNIPLSSTFQVSDCEKAARLQNQIKTWELTERRDTESRKEEYHQAVMEEKWLTVAKREAELASICMELHKKMSANPLTELSGFCEKFAPIAKDHHAGQPPINTALIPETHKRISPNRQDRE